MVDETNTKDACEPTAPLSPSSFTSTSHDRHRRRARHRGKVSVGRTASPDTPLSLPSDDFDLEGPTSSPPTQLAPSLGSSFADEAARGKPEAAEGHEVQRAFDLIYRHYHRRLRQDEVDHLECCRLRLDPAAYSRLREILGQDEDLLSHFDDDLRHDYSPQRGCLKLRLMVTPLHETLKTKFFDDIKSQLSATASRLDDERAAIRAWLSSPGPAPHPTPSTDLAARATALEETVRVIRELEDLSHTTVKLAGGGSACPDGQFRHKSRVPHFVFEIGYSEEATSLRQSAEDYINGTYDIKSVVTIDTAYTREQKRKALLRRQRALRRRTADEERGDGQEQDQASQAQDQVEEKGHNANENETSINRCATLCLYRGTRTIVRDAMIRDRYGTAQDGALVLSLHDLISDETVQWLEDLHPADDLHPSALLIQVSFRQLTAMLEKGDWHQDMQDTTPSPEPDPRAGGRVKRKLCLDVDEDDGNVSTTTGTKRRRRVIAMNRPRTRSVTSSQN